MSARHVGHGLPSVPITGCPACESRFAKRLGRLRIEQRARERRRLLAGFTMHCEGDRQLGRFEGRIWALSNPPVVRFDARDEGRRLSKHLRGKKARRNPRSR